MTAIGPLQVWSTDGGEAYSNTFTDSELAYAKKKRKGGEHLAARLAAKLAFLKAMGKAPSSQEDLTQIWVERKPSGKPVLRISPSLQREFGLDFTQGHRLHLTLSHTGDMAAALVVWEATLS